MDEIDAVGRHRGAGLGGGHDEREQTLNQLLVEMDGFELKDNIILIAATNRPDILDPALLRPGRFDRQIVVDRPDRSRPPQDPRGAREGQADRARDRPRHARRRHARLHRRRPREPRQRGRAARRPPRARRTIEQEELGGRDHARDRRPGEEDAPALRGGAEDHRLPRARPRDRRHYLEHTDEVHKISIISRGQALGYTISLPREDRYLTTKTALMEQLAMTLGGRAAEELVFHEVTTGAANDLEKVTSISKQMIMRYGMSEKLGPRVLAGTTTCRSSAARWAAEPDYSEEIAREIDDEIRRVIEEAHELAVTTLKTHMDELHSHLGPADRARDDRQGSVRAAARGLRTSRACSRTRALRGRGRAARPKERRAAPAAEAGPASPFPGATMQPPPEGSTT
jgi:cell division protease FtsH